MTSASGPAPAGDDSDGSQTTVGVSNEMFDWLLLGFLWAAALLYAAARIALL